MKEDLTMNWIITPDKYLTPEETKQLRKICHEAATIAKSKGIQALVRDRLIIGLALGSGLRVSEMANLKVEDLYLKRGQGSSICDNEKELDNNIILQFDWELFDIDSTFYLALHLLHTYYLH